MVEERITKVDIFRTFKRRDGTTGRIQSLTFSDEKGETRLSLRESRGIERVPDEEIVVVKRFKIINGRVKINEYGTSVNVGSYSVVKVVE